MTPAKCSLSEQVHALEDERDRLEKLTIDQEEEIRAFLDEKEQTRLKKRTTRGQYRRTEGLCRNLPENYKR